jgi:2-keto-4-pentenoate hydratase
MTPPWEDPRVRRGMEKLLEMRRARSAAGEKMIGWKIAFGGAAPQKALGISAQLVGFLSEAGARASGAAISLDGWTNPVAEPEIALTIGRDLPGGSDLQTAQAAIASLGPAIEYIDSAHPPEDPEFVLSGNIAHRHVIFGPSDPSRAGANLQGLAGAVFRRGTEFARTTEVGALTGPLPRLAQYAADYLAAFGERLRAGDIMICGSILPPMPVEPDETEFRYRLDPVGEVSVRYTRG